MVKIAEFQVVCAETFWISQWGTAFMDLTFDLNSAFASLRTRGSWVCFPNIAILKWTFSVLSHDPSWPGLPWEIQLKRSEAKPPFELRRWGHWNILEYWSTIYVSICILCFDDEFIEERQLLAVFHNLSPWCWRTFIADVLVKTCYSQETMFSESGKNPSLFAHGSFEPTAIWRLSKSHHKSKCEGCERDGAVPNMCSRLKVSHVCSSLGNVATLPRSKCWGFTQLWMLRCESNLQLKKWGNNSDINGGCLGEIVLLILLIDFARVSSVSSPLVVMPQFVLQPRSLQNLLHHRQVSWTP